MLVRSENGYHVLSLPFRVKVIVGDLTDQDCRDFAAAVRAEPPASSANDLLNAALRQEREQLDEKLFFEVFATAPKPATKRTHS